MKNHATNIAFSIGFGILAFIASVILLPSAAFLVGGTVHPIWVFLSLASCSGLVYYMLTKYATPKPLLWLGAFLALLAGSVAFSTAAIDPSWDGNSYHKTAIGALHNGWNPVKQDFDTFNVSEQNPFTLLGKGVEENVNIPWVDHYPKGSWIFAASMYDITGNIESGKAITPLVMAALFLFSFGYLYQRLNRNKALVLSLLITFNPITVAQLYSYYVDGLMGNLLIILMLACTLLLDKKARVPLRELVLYGTIVACTILVINLKFTGLAYAGIIIFCYWAYLLVTRQWTTVLRLTYAGLGALAIGFLLIGASSYVKNIATNGHPLYPIMGKDNLSFIHREEPVGYENMSNLYRFIKANLSPTMQLNHVESIAQGAPVPKIPFSIGKDEVAKLDNVDIRQAGYGVWFGGILLLSCAAGIYLLARYGRRYKKELPLFLLPLVALGICVIGVEATWWARYLPHLIVFPVIVILALYLRRETVIPSVLAFALFFNVCLTAFVALDVQVAYQKEVTEGLTQKLICDPSQPAQVRSSMSLEGLLYNVYDSCPNVEALSTEEFMRVPEENRVELFNGIYTVR